MALSKHATGVVKDGYAVHMLYVVCCIFIVRVMYNILYFTIHGWYDVKRRTSVQCLFVCFALLCLLAAHH